MLARRKEDLSDSEAAGPQGPFKPGQWSMLCFFAQTDGYITVKASDFAAKGLARIFGCNPLLGCLGKALPQRPVVDQLSQGLGKSMWFGLGQLGNLIVEHLGMGG